jgi:NADH:ubiquinone oxidoreductase subunit 5 (subunit L)/multisubunit Na+/H+ antiporter MnhA subunit
LLKLLPLSFVMLAVALVFFIFDSFTLRVTPYAIHAVQLVSIYRFITFKWCYDVLYNRHINSPILRKAYTAIFSPVDKGLLEHFGPNGLNKTSNVVGRTLVRFQTGDVTDMAAVILLGGLLLVITASY